MECMSCTFVELQCGGEIVGIVRFSTHGVFPSTVQYGTSARPC